MPDRVFKTFPIQAGDDTITIVASTSGRDRDGDRVKTAGWRLDAFRRNPVLLWAHDHKSLPIGAIREHRGRRASGRAGRSCTIR